MRIFGASVLMAVVPCGVAVAGSIQTPDWILNPAVQQAELHKAESLGALPNDAFWNYVKARHDANPANFDRYHPNIGPLIERFESEALSPPPQSAPAPIPVIPPTVSSTPVTPVVPVSPPVVSLPPIVPPTTNHPTNPPGGGDHHHAVPEPSTFLMGLTSLLGLVGLRMWNRRGV